MAILPSRSSADPIFEFNTESLGRLGVMNVTAGHMIEIEKLLASRNNTSPSELTDTFIKALVRTADGKPLTSEQISFLSNAEKEDFAGQLVQSETYLYRKQIPEYHKDESGTIIANFKEGEVTLPRNPDESARDHFYRAYTNYRKRRYSIPESLSNSIKNLTGWTGSATLDALAKNARISTSLSDSLAGMRGFKLPSLSPWEDAVKGLSLPKPVDLKLTDAERDLGGVADDSTHPSVSRLSDMNLIYKNPIHDTNDLLGDLVSRFERFEGVAAQTVELVQSMNTAASGLLVSFSEGARSTERYAKYSLAVAFIAFLAAVAMPIYQIWHEDSKSRQQDNDTKQIVRQLTEVQQRASADVRGAIATQDERAHIDQTELLKAIATLADALRATTERQRQPPVDSQPDTSKAANHK